MAGAAYIGCTPRTLRESLMQIPFDSESLALAHELAHARAARLREQAIDDFWRGTDAVLRTGMTRSQRAAQRLLHRLRQHAARRQAPLQPSA
jgi:hypothetical protein